MNFGFNFFQFAWQMLQANSSNSNYMEQVWCQMLTPSMFLGTSILCWVTWQRGSYSDTLSKRRITADWNLSFTSFTIKTHTFTFPVLCSPGIQSSSSWLMSDVPQRRSLIQSLTRPCDSFTQDLCLQPNEVAVCDEASVFAVCANLDLLH